MASESLGIRHIIARLQSEVAMMDCTQRDAVQRRAAESGMAVGTKSHSKMRPISSRDARPLQRRVRRLAAGDRLPPACADHTNMVSHGTTRQSFESPSA